MQLLPLIQTNHTQLSAQETRNLENPLDIDAISIGDAETENNTSNSSLQDMLQDHARIVRTVLKNAPLTGVTTDKVLTHFIEQIDELKGHLAQQNQIIETSTQQNVNLQEKFKVLEEKLKAKEQENAALKQELETNKPKAMAFEEQLQTKKEKDIALKQKFEVEILPLLTAPNWENWKTREKGIFALSSLSDWPVEAEQHIDPLFNDRAWEVQQTATLLLGPRFSPIQLKQRIIPLLDREGEQQWRIRQAAVIVLGQRFSSVQVEQPLIALLKDPAWEVRKEVVTVFGQHLLPAQLEQHIIPLLGDVAWQVRKEVVIVLSQRSSPALAEQKIIPLSTDVAWEVREAVAERLGTLGMLGPLSERKETREVLIALKEKDSFPWVRHVAASILSWHP